MVHLFKLRRSLSRQALETRRFNCSSYEKEKINSHIVSQSREKMGKMGKKGKKILFANFVTNFIL